MKYLFLAIPLFVSGHSMAHTPHGIQKNNYISATGTTPDNVVNNLYEKAEKRGERILKITSVGGNNILHGSAITVKNEADI
ncbi:TPA: hypothetical protein PWK54_005102 [Escherichia coli]|jgi:Protein of unknown function (DUF1471).|uniref:multiple stress resistance protein BhsA n=1 Tax=Escherichia coli TaxID=562 RepID=UPI001D7F21D1|nr:DUF1471 domain-containing protein [Escherichia coli]HCS5607288.1 hypothetical protein [Escherichia coli]HCW2811143.1 hypothetical protein [Escherichia coli]HDL0260844.1 hypothetical protein [Escherichia coli]HDL0323308.1 hypothetical protein [Escherichia coli]